MSYESVIAQEEARSETFLSRVYAWMSFALVITAVTAWVVASSPSLLVTIVGNKAVFFGLIIAEILLVVGLSRGINKISAGLASFGFFVYSIVNGLTLSVIFIAYTYSSIASTFAVTAGMFGALSLYGFVTKRDLSGLGHFLFMALIGLIIASVVNIFFSSSTLYWITTYAGVLIFTGLTAYDTQKIKRLNIRGFAGDEQERKVAILGALTLYLDFINLFLYLLRLMGRRR